MTRRIRPSMSGNNQGLTPTTGDSMYSFSAATSLQQDFTPHSAVSSFNLPARIDTNLYTPISMTNSPLLPIKTDTAMQRDVELKMSPTGISPNYNIFGDIDDGEFTPRYNGSMKPKAASYQIAISGSGLGPESPAECTSHPDPYYGSFLVSAQAPQSRASPSLSPHMQPRTGQNANDYFRYQQTSSHNSSSFRPNTQAPTLIAPNPTTLRPAIARYRQNPLPTNKSSSTQPMHISAFSQGAQSRGKIRQKKSEPNFADYQTVISTPELSVQITDVERFILDLRYKDGLPWKEVAKVFSRKHNKSTEVAALQMRRRRLMEKLWESSCELAVSSQDVPKWEGICKQLQKYAPKRSSKEVTQKKWNENSSLQGTFNPQYGMQPRQRQRTSSDFTAESFDHESWSDERESTGHSLQESDPGGMMSAMSSVAMGDVQRRAASEAGIQLHLQQQHHQQQQQQQHQDLLYAQQQQSSWGLGHNA